MRMMRLTVRRPVFDSWHQASLSPHGLSVRSREDGDDEDEDVRSYVASGGQYYECQQTRREVEEEYADAMRGELQNRELDGSDSSPGGISRRARAAAAEDEAA